MHKVTTEHQETVSRKHPTIKRLVPIAAILAVVLMFSATAAYLRGIELRNVAEEQVSGNGLIYRNASFIATIEPDVEPMEVCFTMDYLPTPPVLTSSFADRLETEADDPAAALAASGLTKTEAETCYNMVDYDGKDGFYKVTIWNGATVSGSEFLFNGEVELLDETQVGPWQVVRLTAKLPEDSSQETRNHLLCYHTEYGCLVQLTGTIDMETLEQMFDGLTVHETSLPAISSFTGLCVLDGGVG